VSTIAYDRSGRIQLAGHIEPLSALARFVDYLFSRIDKLQAPGFDPNGSRSISQRRSRTHPLRAAQAWLDRQPRGAAGINNGRSTDPPSVAINVVSGVALGARCERSDGASCACSLMQHAERVGMSGQVVRATSRQPARPAPAATTGSSARPPHPWDYTQIVSATTFSRAWLG